MLKCEDVHDILIYHVMMMPTIFPTLCVAPILDIDQYIHLNILFDFYVYIQQYVLLFNQNISPFLSG